MKKCLSILLVLVLTISSLTVIVRAEIAELSDSGANVELSESGVGSVESAISWAIDIAKDDKHGYSQSRRTGPDYDCASFVSTAFKQAGFSLSGEDSTGTIRNSFVNAGFTWIPASSIEEYPEKSTNLKRGDVLLGSGHTALYIGKDQIVHAIFGTYDKYDEGHPGDQTGNEIAIKTFSSSSYSRAGGWLGVLRYSGVAAVDLGSKFYANIVPTATDSNDLASTGANGELAVTGAKYAANWRFWSKGASDYSGIVLYGCWVDSQAKMLMEAGCGYSGFNPDRYYEWQVKNGYIDSGFYQTDGKNAPVAFAKSQGKSLESITVNYSPSSSNLWTYINNGYFTIIKVTGITHYVYIDNDTSKSTGEIYIMESFRDKTETTGSYKLYSRYNGAETAYVYKGSNSNGINSQDLGPKFYANIVPTGASGALAVSATSANDVNLNALDYSDYQKWLFERQSNMSYKITNVKTGKCLDIASGVMGNETNIRVYASNDTPAQSWFIVKNGNGYNLTSAKDTGYVVDIKGGTMSAGANIQLYKNNNSKAQIFSINKTVNHKDLGASFYANIICSNKNYAVSSNKDENVIIYKADYSDYQKWYFERQPDMTYKITNIKTGKVLDVAGAKKEDKTNVRVYTSNNTGAQKWYVVASGSGYSLIPKSNIESALDVAGKKFANNTNVQEYKINNSEAQWFYISKTVNHKDIGESFYATIVSNDPAYSVAANQDDNVVLQTTANTNNQKWLFERQPDKTYKITNVESEKVLDVVGGYTDNYTNIQVYASNDTNAQRWYVVANGDGYSLVPKSSINSALDTAGGELEDGTMNVHQWTIKLHDAQRLYINQANSVDPEYIELEDDFQLYIGDTKLVTVTIGPDEADQRVIWVSEDPDIITIDDSGNVTAVGIGEGYISATTSNGLMTRCRATISEPVISPDYITLSEDSLFLDIDQTSQLSAMVYPEEANQSVVWYSEDDEIATVDEAGIVTGVGEGETIICAQTEDGSVQAYCSVYVYPPYVEPEYVEENGFGGIVNDDGTVYLFSYDGDARDIIIPSIIKGKVVSEISYYFLEYEKDYDSVTVPKTISTIGFRAFGYYVDYQDEDTV